MAEQRGQRGEDFGRSSEQRDAERSERAREVLEEIRRRRDEAGKRGDNFTAPSEEELKRKLFGVHSPQIVWQSWGGSAPRGGTLTYSVGINNPDAYTQYWLFGHVFVGPANIAPSVGESLAAVDARFPRLTMPAFAGLSVPSGTTATLTFNIEIPTNVQVGNYMGNTYLFQATWHDVGTYFDRSLFVFGVT
ncbi:MAG TPA: hypothetical protein VHJ34_05515 [Actinomycetota bacterium]|nr:hypothetical protein [Actinomycetota bacterium]